MKKLDLKTQQIITQAVDEISSNPEIGERKRGDLKEFRVHKFKVRDQIWLLAYRLGISGNLELIDLGSHQNFYRVLRRSRKG